MSGCENYWKILNEVNEGIKFAESKALAAIGTAGILIAFLFANENLETVTGNPVLSVLYIFCVGFLVVSVVTSLLCVKPNFSNESGGSLIYFNSILQTCGTKEEFQKVMSDTFSVDGEFEAQLAEQIYTKSKIARNKYRLVNISITSFVLFLLSLIFSIVLREWVL